MMNWHAKLFFCFLVLGLLFEVSSFCDVIDSFEKPRKKLSNDRVQIIESSKKSAKRDLPVGVQTLKKTPVKDGKEAVSMVRNSEKQKAAMQKFKRCKLRFWTDGAFLNRTRSILNLPNPVRIEKCDLKMRANRAKMIYGKRMKKIIRVEAFGNVRVEKTDSWTGLPVKAKSSALVYNNQSQKILMSGNPASLNRGGAEVFESKKIEYHIVEDVIKTAAAEGELVNP